MKFSKQEYVLIKNHIPRNIDTTSGDIKTLEPFMHITIPPEHNIPRRE
jgi:hypothetical protein